MSHSSTGLLRTADEVNLWVVSIDWTLCMRNKIDETNNFCVAFYNFFLKRLRYLCSAKTSVKNTN